MSGSSSATDEILLTAEKMDSLALTNDTTNENHSQTIEDGKLDASVDEEEAVLLEGFEFDPDDFDTKSERPNQGLPGGVRHARCNGGRGNEVKLCIANQVMGLSPSSSESDTDEEFMGYFRSQLNGAMVSKGGFGKYSEHLDMHKAKKQARRDGYDDKEKARRRAAKDKIRAEKAAALKQVQNSVPWEPGTTLHQFFMKDFIPVEDYDEDTLEAARQGINGIEIPVLLGLLDRKDNMLPDVEVDVTPPNNRIPLRDRREHEGIPGIDRTFGTRLLINEADVFQKNAWDNVQWGEEQKQEAAEKVDNNSKVLVDESIKQNLESTASQCWDKFYDIHQNKFFRDRRWLFTEFPELLGPYGNDVDPKESAAGVIKRRRNESFPGENSKFRILEIGCGNGSTVFPVLLDSNHPDTYVYCCDFSPSAVEVVRTSPKLDPLRCTPFVWDITEESPELPFPPESIDVVTLIFVLSAITPEKFVNVAQNIYKCLKPGGVLLFRDYGLYDLVQLRQPIGRCISENFYFRGDGTRVYFFEEDEVQNLFSANGMEKISLFVDRRLQVNRLRELKMYRIWIQGKFRKPGTGNDNAEAGAMKNESAKTDHK